MKYLNITKILILVLFFGFSLSVPAMQLATCLITKTKKADKQIIHFCDTAFELDTIIPVVISPNSELCAIYDVNTFGFKIYLRTGKKLNQRTFVGEKMYLRDDGSCIVWSAMGHNAHTINKSYLHFYSQEGNEIPVNKIFYYNFRSSF